jgi:hypothetical protein
VGTKSQSWTLWIGENPFVCQESNPDSPRRKFPYTLKFELFNNTFSAHPSVMSPYRIGDKNFLKIILILLLILGILPLFSKNAKWWGRCLEYPLPPSSTHDCCSTVFGSSLILCFMRL